jgi:hypothetical protein
VVVVRRCFIVANRTLEGDRLAEEIRRRTEQGACSFHVIVPASPPPLKGLHSWTDGEARALAQQRLDRMLDWLRSLGCDCDGEVGDEHPQLAVEDSIRSGREVDEIIVSTLPPGMSRWLKLDIPNLLARYGVPVTHVVVEPTPKIVSPG